MTTKVKWAIGCLAMAVALAGSLHWRIAAVSESVNARIADNDKKDLEKFAQSSQDVSNKLTEIATRQLRVLSDINDVGGKMDRLQERVTQVETEVRVHTRETRRN